MYSNIWVMTQNRMQMHMSWIQKQKLDLLHVGSQTLKFEDSLLSSLVVTVKQPNCKED